MATGHSVDLLQGEKLMLLEQAVYVPDYHALLLSDVHLGKADTLQMAGIPVAQQVNEEMLERLRSHCQQVQPQQIFIMGDLCHSRPSLSEPVKAAWCQFLEETTANKVTLMVGNHDRAALGPVFDMDYSTSPISLGRILLSYDPVGLGTMPKGHLNICGHIRPTVKLQSAVDSLRFPCFYHEHQPQRLTLPSFGSSTDGQDVPLGKGRTAYILVEGCLMALDAQI